MLNVLLRWVFRIVLFVAGLVFAASLLVLLMGFALLWSLRAAWARLTGQRVTPWKMRTNPREGWRKVYRAGQGEAVEPVLRKRDGLKDVTDVEVK